MFINSKKNFEISGEGGKLVIPRGLSEAFRIGRLHTGWSRLLLAMDLLQRLRASRTGRLRKRIKVHRKRQKNMISAQMKPKSRVQLVSRIK